MDRDDGLDIRGDELETKFGFLTDSLDSYLIHMKISIWTIDLRIENSGALKLKMVSTKIKISEQVELNFLKTFLSCMQKAK